jgi:hypothetical protein
MADFRKWLIAFAAVALLLSLGTPANAQLTNQFNCIASSGNPPIVRSEGVTELVGDVLLQCAGGTSTPIGVNIPQSNIQIFLNTNVTSRILNTTTNLSEATLLIDEPYPSNPNPSTAPQAAGTTTTQLSCQATNQANCAIIGIGGGTGAVGPYNGAPGHYNIFQGYQVPGVTNSIAWLGVPVDAPGTLGLRTIRITNVRANACNLAGGATTSLIPTIITMFIAVNGSQQVLISNPSLTVGYIEQGLLSSNKTGTFTQCNSVNPGATAFSTGFAGLIAVTATEGFASSWKVRNYAQVVAMQQNSSALALQNVPSFPYNTESGFVATAIGGAVTGAPGVADAGTQLQFNFAGVGAGVSLFVPTTLTFTSPGYVGAQAGYAVLVSGAPGGAVTVSGTGASVTYEVLFAYPNITESATLSVGVSYTSNTTQNLPALGTSQISVNFAPLSSVPTASSSAPIPRFCQPYPLRNIFTINICSCNLLFPFVTNQAGFDTGVAIANTTLDPFGTALQQGIVTLYYYGNTTGGGAAPTPQKSASVAAGTELVFTLSGGGDHGITATPGFQGYIISIASFQYCHAFAFISDMGSQKLAEGYLAIQLDLPVLNRTGVNGENEGN